MYDHLLNSHYQTTNLVWKIYIMINWLAVPFSDDFDKNLNQTTVDFFSKTKGSVFLCQIAKRDAIHLFFYLICSAGNDTINDREQANRDSVRIP